MILFLDFASFGDSAFYLNYWRNLIKTSNKNHFFIYHSKTFEIGKTKLGIPVYFIKNRFLILVFKLIIQSLIVLGTLLITYLFKNKVRIIFNLHQPFIFWIWLLKYSSRKKTHLTAVIHDVIEFDTSNYSKHIISTNYDIIKRLDSVILHGGIDIFIKTFGSHLSINVLPFPNRNSYQSSVPIIKGKYFYIPGQYREEKGFSFVVQNWPEDEGFKLVISTKLPDELERLVSLKDNIIYRPLLVSTEQFQNVISNSFVCLLMYSSGTNSGILETVISNNIRCLVSNIPMFVDHSQSKQFFISKSTNFEFTRNIRAIMNSEKRVYNNKFQENINEYKTFLNSI